MAGVYLDELHHIVRQVAYGRQVRGADGEILGVNYNAFALREIDGKLEEYLSVAWCEFFDGETCEQRMKTINQLRSARSDKASTVYWIAKISEMRSALGGHGFRAISEPIGSFTSHAALRRWPTEFDLLGKLAAETLADLILSSTIERD